MIKNAKNNWKKKDYYDILNLKKDATQDEIKSGYKKQAVRFHPDKNHSKLAEECFKKVSEAYQCLNDPEKKAFYDKYGNEAEFKEKYYQANHRYYQEEMDPFEAFNIFFGNGFYPNGGRYHYSNEDNSNDGLRNRRSIIQLFPFLLMFLISFFFNNSLHFLSSESLPTLSLLLVLLFVKFDEEDDVDALFWYE